MKNKLLVLVTGTPGAGKTTFANSLSSKMAGIPSINTDIVKAAYVNENPEVLNQSSHSAWKLFGECNSENIIRGYNLLAHELFTRSIDIADKLFGTYNTVIIEGLGIDLNSIESLKNRTAIIHLMNGAKSVGYQKKILYRNNKQNNWEKNARLLRIVDDYMTERLKTLSNVRTVEITKAYDIDELIDWLEEVRSYQSVEEQNADQSED